MTMKMHMCLSANALAPMPILYMVLLQRQTETACLPEVLRQRATSVYKLLGRERSP